MLSTTDDHASIDKSVGANRICSSGDGACPLAKPLLVADVDDDRRLGTKIEWAQSPDDASLLAQQQGKLLLLLQVSGNFAREEFT